MLSCLSFEPPTGCENSTPPRAGVTLDGQPFARFLATSSLARLPMRFPSFAILCLMLSAAAIALAQGPRAAPSADPSATQLDRLIQQLGDPSYRQRLAARKALEAMGEPALERLRREAETNVDHEIRRQASYLKQAVLYNGKNSKSIGLEMSVIRPGTFAMGYIQPGRSGAAPVDAVHRVTISRTFLLGSYEVSQAQFLKVMGRNPSRYSASGEGKDKIGDLPIDQFPVESTTWFDAIAFCNALSKLDGFPQHYLMEEVKQEKGSIVSAKVSVISPLGYRLPTEAEWEYACRAGTITLFHYGNSSTGYESNLRAGPSHGYGAAHADDLNRPTKVGSYAANPWGIFDMHGNVAEWCEDWYDKDYYSKSPDKNPPGPESGTHRVLRGGSWMVTSENCRSASRFYQVPSEGASFVGFRIARTPQQ